MADRTKQLLLDPTTDPLALPNDWLDDCVTSWDGLDFVGIEHATCTRSKRVLVDLNFNVEYPLACLSWRCEGCQRRKWAAAKHFFAAGMRRAWEADKRVRFLTITDRTGAMAIPEFSACWDDFAKMLRRGGPSPARPEKGAPREEWERWYERCRRRRPLLEEYAMVLEVGRKGNRQLHAHVLMTGGYLHHLTLKKWARKYGFGEVVDIREVARGTDDSLGNYAAKMAAYTTKTGEVIEALAERTRQRVRPVRASRGWLPGGLRGVEEALGIRQPQNTSGKRGEWLIVEHDGTGRWTRFRPLGRGGGGWRLRA